MAQSLPQKQPIQSPMSSRSPYDVIGIPRNAEDEAIKRAFRKKAKELHPDRNMSDPKAQARFSELNQAYEILSDKDKRKQFDRGEIDGEGKARFEGFSAGPGRGQGGPSMDDIFRSFGFGMGGSGDPFADLARGTGRAQGGPSGFPGGSFQQTDPMGGATRDAEGELVLSLEEAAKGGSKRVTMPSGRDGDVVIPRGIMPGQVIRVRGQGKPVSLGRPAGDLLLKVRFASHERFQLEGKSIRTTVELPLSDAVLGGAVRVPTLTGALELTIPPGTDGGKVFRLKGKGFPAADGAGDLLVRIDIVLPKGDVELEALMRIRKARSPV
jgi:DnaJ-class molecular chaperone